MEVYYKPDNSSLIENALTVENNGQMLMILVESIQLNGSSITLPGSQFRNLPCADLLPQLKKQWIKGFNPMDYVLGTKLASPFQIAVNLGSAAFDLIAIPVEEYRKSGNIVYGIANGTSAFLRKVSLQVLNLTATSAVTGTKFFGYLDKLAGGRNEITNVGEQHISLYSKQHKNFIEAIPHAKNTLFSQLSNAGALLATNPVYNAPSAVAKGFVGIFASLGELLLSVRNQLSPDAYADVIRRYKNPKEYEYSRYSLMDSNHTSEGSNEDQLIWLSNSETSNMNNSQ